MLPYKLDNLLLVQQNQTDDQLKRNNHSINFLGNLQPFKHNQILTIRRAYCQSSVRGSNQNIPHAPLLQSENPRSQIHIGKT